jgi:hypothetical protein
VLDGIRVGRHTGYDRVVFQFDGGVPAPHLEYVERVTEDPSDRQVRLRGTAFLRVVFHGATLDNSFQISRPSEACRYGGPQRVTPDLPQVKEVAVAGDFEAVLSFGIGVERRSTPRVFQLTKPSRVVIDLPHTAPFRGIWPVRTLAQAEALQRSVDSGHQPWLLSPTSVVIAYAQSVLRWHQPAISKVDARTFRVREGSTTATATVTVAQPARTGPTGIWVVTGVHRQ